MKEDKGKEEGSVGCWCLAGSHSLEGTLSGCVQRGHSDYYLRHTLRRTELGKEGSRCVDKAPGWSARRRKEFGGDFLWRAPSAKWPAAAPLYCSLKCATSV